MSTCAELRGTRPASWRLVGAAVTSAALYAAAFPPLGLFPLAWIALVPLLTALGRSSPLGGFGLGLLWSLAVGLFSSWWLPEMIGDYFSAGIVGGWLAAAVATLGTGVFYGVFGAWLSWFARRRPPLPLETALVWGACEYSRTVAPLANPWVLSGYSQRPFETLVQVADVGGVVLVGMILASCNAAIAGWLHPPLQRRRLASETVALAATVVAALAYGGFQLGRSFGTGAPVRVALVQSAIPRERRFDSRHRSENLAHNADLTWRAGRSRPALILLPELAVDVPLDSRSREGQMLARVSEASGADVLVGAPGVLDLLVLRRTYNSLFVLRGDAQLDRYDKVDLMPFSERNPFGSWLRIGRDDYIPGAARRPIVSRSGPVGVLLCSEAMLAAPARELARQGAELLSNPANDSWFAPPAANMQLDIAVFRAIETRRWLVRPTMTGVTAIIDPHGRVTAAARTGVPDLIVGEVKRSRVETPFVRFGDIVPGLAVAGALGTSAMRARRSSVRHSSSIPP